MDRKKILALKQDELLDIVNKEFDITISGLEDAKNLSDAWKIVEKLEEKGWRFDIISAKALKQVVRRIRLWREWIENRKW